MGRLWEWTKGNWPIIPIILALILLAIALFLNPSNFLNLAWFALVALTAVYAYATLMVMRAASRQTRETKRMIEEMRQSRLDAVKPMLSLQPEEFTFGGDFNVHLRNSGGVAKDVKVDVEITELGVKKALFVPAINREHSVRLDIGDIRRILESGGSLKVHVNFKDSYGQSLKDSLSIDFSKLKEEGREIKGQYSELYGIDRSLEDITRKIDRRGL